MTAPYEPIEPPRTEIDALPGVTVLEFGTNWCGFCRMAQPHIQQAFSSHDGVRHIKIEDGSDRKLGRTFRVQLWPTLIFMKGGVETARVVRPGSAQEVAQGFEAVAA
ncbi:MAG: thioredoxin family protein [Burkholderiaceae bacterium]